MTLGRWLALSFFFQAEDGIRDWSVTGVQTCALPIFETIARRRASRARDRLDEHPHAAGAAHGQGPARPSRVAALGLQGLPSEGPIELHLPAALAALPRRAVQRRRGADVQAQAPDLAAHHRK